MVLDYEKRGKANRCAAVSTKPVTDIFVKDQLVAMFTTVR